MVSLETLCQETGLSWPALPTYDEWAELGPRIASVNNVSRWALADWLCTGEDLFGAKADQVISSLGLAYHTLENLRWVARKVPPSVRQPMPVSFSHHALVAALPPAEQAWTLAECALYKWSRDEFRDYLVKEGQIPASPQREDWRKDAYNAMDLLVSDLLKIMDRIRP